ncbi:spermidine synthase [Phaeacidiphilus oryzae]|uniref:spermidine synthase n=1 Tax=Phaeacidiphilus oryzae TaxID=348818 RepID=UPI000A85807F|nr:fused MFS/spermidine synthase [Phaeacidiphilus oryzae]
MSDTPQPPAEDHPSIEAPGTDSPAGSGPAAEPERVPRIRRTATGEARLIPDLDRPNAWLLILDGAPQSHVDLDDPTHLEFEYARRIAHAADLAPAAGPGEPLDALHLGAGALALPRYLAATRPGSRQTAVEYDGPLAELIAAELPWAGPEPRPEVVVADAREATEAAPAASRDLVVADVFGGDRIPAHLTTVEFLRAAARVLRPDGLYAANLADGGALAFARGQLATAATVFPQLCLIAEPSVLRGRRYGNLVLVASRAELPVPALSRRAAADPFPARVVHGAALTALIGDAAPVTDADARPSPPPPSGAFTVS